MKTFGAVWGWILAICVPAAAAAPVSPDNAPEKWFRGEKLIMLRENTPCQNTGILVVTGARRVIVFDGGVRGDAAHLIETVRAINGGKIACWFLTHPHADHIGALLEILEKHPDALAIDEIRCDFPDQAWADHAKDGADLREFNAVIARTGRKPVRPQCGEAQEFDGVRVAALNRFEREPYALVNDSSIVFDVRLADRRLLVLGDIYKVTSQQLIDRYGDDLKADIVQMAHHGQNGATRQFYERVRPSVALWPTPEWLWENNRNGKHPGSGPWRTNEVKCWMQELGVRENYVTRGRDLVFE